MKDRLRFKYLNQLYQVTPEIKIDNSDRIVIFSDLHIGTGGSNDDFRKNAELFGHILKNYYLLKDYILILNGDIEELYKFSLKNIKARWDKIYQIFKEFADSNSFYKIFGNHDYDLQFMKDRDNNRNIREAVKLNYYNNHLFIYHGHQVSDFLETYNKFSRSIVRFIAKPLRIGNSALAVDSKKIFTTELKSYEFASRKKIISIIGHTHKPLFESMSKKDDLKFRVENLIRKYPAADDKKKKKIEKKIQNCKNELLSINGSDEVTLRSVIHNDGLLVPSLFNSGSVIGKRGITCIEISHGCISLIYWFDKSKSNRYIKYKGVETEQLGNSNFYKALLKKENLNNLFTRIKLLS